MRYHSLLAATLPLTTSAINVVISNDDGWAEKNIRVFYDSLTDAGYDTLISAPAENQSGTGSLDGEPDEVDDGCEFDSCPPGSPPYGKNASMPHINYVNSYPVTAMRYGIQNLSSTYFDSGSPDIAAAGPNVGSNLGIVTFFSGTVGAATEAAKQGLPAIAFSGKSGDAVAWNTATETYQQVYADLSTTVTQALINSGTPYLPEGIWLNVNYPEVSDSTCSSPSDFSFVLSRIHTAVPLVSDDDVTTCDNGGRLPTESTVIHADGCYASISVGKAENKLDADADDQETVMNKLGSILTCLPS